MSVRKHLFASLILAVVAAAGLVGCRSSAQEAGSTARAPLAKTPRVYTVGARVFGLENGVAKLASPPVTPLAGWLTPAAVPSPDGRYLAYNTWQELRADDPGLSWSDQGIESGDPLATPSLRVYDTTTGSDDVLARGAFSVAWGKDGRLAYFTGAERDYRAGVSYVGRVVVRRSLGSKPTVWSTEVGRYIVVGWAGRHFDWAPEPEAVRPVVDVTAGVRVAIEVFSGPGGVVFPTPGYNAQHGLAGVTGRAEHLLDVPPTADRAEIDLDRLDRLFAEGAQTLILTQPHNPWGRVFTRVELESIRDVVVRHGARVVSDEIHAPLVLPGAEHLSYLAIEGTHDHAVAVVAASKAFNTAGLKCAQLVVPDRAAQQVLSEQPMARNDSYSSLGVVAARAAYDRGDGWLASLVERLDQQRALLGSLLADHLPEVRMRPVEATYLAWLDASAYGHDDAAAVALERGRVQVSDGASYAPDSTGHVRLNFATSPERLAEIVERLAKAWT